MLLIRIEGRDGGAFHKGLLGTFGGFGKGAGTEARLGAAEFAVAVFVGVAR